MPNPVDYAAAVFRAYEALQVGTDPSAIDEAESGLRAVNGTHPLLRELIRKAALIRRREPDADAEPRLSAHPPRFG
jgi:hypothetical protein